MKENILNILEKVKQGEISVDEAYFQFIAIKDDLHKESRKVSNFVQIAKENNLSEIGFNVWINKDNPKCKYRLTPIGFSPIIDFLIPKKSLFERIFNIEKAT